MLQDSLNSLSPLNSPVSGRHIAITRTGWVQVCWPWSSKVIFRARLSPWPQSAYDVPVAKVLLWPFYKGQAMLEPPSHPLKHRKKPGWCFQMQRVKGKYKPLLSLKPFTLTTWQGIWDTRVGWGRGSTNRTRLLWDIPAEASWKHSPRWPPWCARHHPPGLGNPEGSNISSKSPLSSL